MEEITHFAGIVPEERYKNDVLNELRKIRELLERDCKTVQREPSQLEKQSERTKRPTQRRGVK